MPLPRLKTPRQEDRWERAKELVRGQYPHLSEESDRFYQRAVSLYLKLPPGRSQRQEAGATTAADVALGPAEPLFRRQVRGYLKRKKP